jgi:hypothetical protein
VRKLEGEAGDDEDDEADHEQPCCQRSLRVRRIWPGLLAILREHDVGLAAQVEQVVEQHERPE